MTPPASAPRTNISLSDFLSLSPCLSQLVRRAPTNPPPTTSTYLDLAIYLPGSQRSARLFSIGGKAETCRVCFSPPLWSSANFFFSFFKPRCQRAESRLSEKHEVDLRVTVGGWGGGAEGRPVRRDGALRLPCLGIIIFCVSL